MTATDETIRWLPSWTRTLNEAEAGTLLDAARGGLRLEVWAASAHELLPQASLERRRELIRMVREDLLDHVDGAIQETAFLRLFQAGSAHRRRSLFFGRLLARRALISPALDALITPALVAASAPLAPATAGDIPAEAWDAWLRSRLKPDIGDEAFKKTRSTLQTAFADAGVLTITGARSRHTRVCHGEPDALAFTWVVVDELVQRGGEADDAWVLRDSFASRLFGTRVEYGMAAIEAGIAAGLLRRSYLAGAPRVLAGER